MPADLIVLSHVRWTDAWQRPHHVVSRLARERRTWFVEGPSPGGHQPPRLVTLADGDVTRAWLEPPPTGEGDGDAAGPETVETYRRLLPGLVGPADGDRVVWLCTPLALDIAGALDPTVLVYDVAIDELLSLRGVPQGVALAQKEALARADVVFTASPSLHRSVIEQGRPDAHLAPGGVDPAHFAAARRPRTDRGRPVAGYVGPIDERIDVALVAALATALADWEIRIVGPVGGIDPAALPRAANITYPGPVPYAALPEVMADLDVAVMPLAVGAAPRSTNPTTALEHLAAGLPVVTTPVPDVVTQFGTIVDVADDAGAFALACVRALGQSRRRHRNRVAQLLRRHDWDAVTAGMAAVVHDAGTQPSLEDLLA
jgi:glycosyltransferase involved in cell wall biosynthesis